MAKCESLRMNMYRITHTGKSVNFPVTQSSAPAVSYLYSRPDTPLFNFKNAPVIFSTTPESHFNLKSYRSRAFAVSAPELWNKLPDDICSWYNLNLIERKIKTHLYKNYFYHV